MQQTMTAAAAAATGNTQEATSLQRKKPLKAIDRVRTMMKRSNEQLMMVLQTEEKVKRFTREFMTLLQGNETLLQCDPKSLVGSAIKAAQLNLSLDKTLGQAYVVPYKGIAEFQIGYQGYLELARRSGEVIDVFANIVYEGEHFVQKYTLDGAYMEHTPASPSERGERLGVYMVATLKSGGHHYEFMWAEEVLKLKSLSPGAKRSDSPWNTHEDAMWKKSVIKRSSTFLPLSVEVKQSIYIDKLQDEGRGYADYGKLVDGEEAEVVETTAEEREAA